MDNRIKNLSMLASTAGLLVLFFACSSFFSRSEWVSLLDKDLSHWDMYLSYRHQDDYKGALPTDEAGNPITPIGYQNNVNQVFSVQQENGEPVLRISGEIYGSIFTKQEYENYHLRLKVKWGQKKWIPRLNKLKDSGILYHSVGESGKDYWRAWKLSQEFQIMEGHMGDYWTIANSAIDVRAFIPEGNMNMVGSAQQPFLAIGAGTDLGGFCLRSTDQESRNGDWTEIELICFEGKSLHIVNGQVVMVLQNSRYWENNAYKPLTKGSIQLQSEAAEVFYKDIQIKNLPELPKKYTTYFAGL